MLGETCSQELCDLLFLWSHECGGVQYSQLHHTCSQQSSKWIFETISRQWANALNEANKDVSYDRHNWTSDGWTHHGFSSVHFFTSFLYMNQTRYSKWKLCGSFRCAFRPGAESSLFDSGLSQWACLHAFIFLRVWQSYHYQEQWHSSKVGLVHLFSLWCSFHYEETSERLWILHWNFYCCNKDWLFNLFFRSLFCIQWAFSFVVMQI